MPQAQLSADEVVNRGEIIYNQRIRTKVEAENLGKYIVIDIDTGDYEIGEEYLDITRRIRETRADANLCILRIGYPAAARLGGGRMKRTGV